VIKKLKNQPHDNIYISNINDFIMETIHSTIESFVENFGKISVKMLCNIPIFEIDNSDYTKEKLYELCKQLFSNKMMEINAVYFDNVVFNTFNNNHKDVFDMITSIFVDEAQQFHQWLLSLSRNDYDSPAFMAEFRKRYNSYTSKSHMLSTKLWYFTRHVEFTNNGKSYSYINLVKNYIFYMMVINQQYTNFNDSPLYLYEILTELVRLRTIGISDVLLLFNMYNFYVRLSNIPKNRVKLFNIDLENKFVVNLGDDEEFIKDMLQYINDGIMKIDNENNDKKINEINDLLNILSRLNNSNLFKGYYDTMLETRLLNNKSLITIERKMAQTLTSFGNEFYTRIMNKINDIETKQLLIQKYITIEITISQTGSQKDTFDIKKLNRSILKPFLMRYGSWANSNVMKQTTLSVPIEMKPYINSFTSFILKRYPHRQFKWNFDLGTSILKIKLKDIEYLIEMTTPQMFLFLQFNKKESVRVKDIASNMGITLQELGPILNSFLRSRILKRESGNVSPDSEIFLNNDFTYANASFSIVSLMQQVQPKISSN